MKFFATLAVASALALASAQEIPACPPSIVTTASTGPDADACKTASGFSAAAALAVFPTSDVIAKACANPNCMNLLKSVSALVPTECTLASIKVKESLLDKIAGACKTAGGAAPAGKAGSGSGAGAPAVKVPEPSKAGSAAGPAMPAASEAAKTVPTPTPTPSASKKSGASTVAVATGAVVMAVAATML